MGLIYSVSVLFFAFMIFRMYLKKDIRPYMTSRTEYQLGFWTIHGDVGDFDPIQDLWKTEVYGLANYLQDHYKSKALEALRNDYKETCDNYKAMSCAIYNSCKLVPTDGLGISNSDLEQIGAKSYAEVDDILQTNANNIFDSTGRWVQPLMEKYGEDVVVKVLSRHQSLNV